VPFSVRLPHRSRRLALSNGLTYHVLEWDGPGELTFVLVHGFADIALTWRPVAERLAQHGHVIAPDLRGHGDSDWIGAGGYYHFLDYVVDLDEVIARLARKRLIVVGHSMGGSITSYWAGTRPTRLSALAILEGLGPPDMSEADPSNRMAGWIEAWRVARGKHKTLPSVDDAARRLLKHDPLLSPDFARELAAAGTRPVDGGVVWKQDPLHNTIGPYPYRLDMALKFWRKITCPVLIVDGDRSKLNLPIPERAERRKAFANHRHVVLPDAGHALQRHQPAALAQLILELAK
jgi:pimeloyl-ACP methyl ester carboxylesterase